MPSFSKLLNLVPNLRRSSLIFRQNGLINNQIRESHGRAMFIRPAGLPFVLFMAYENFFVGPATIAEIPEGYEPKYWEYHKNPIQRFLSRYVYEIPERAYERSLHSVYVENCKQKMRQLENKVRAMMQEKQDYKAWYYVPVPKEPFELKQENIEKHGRLGYDPKYTK